jgi:hypothetical protein
LPETLAADAAPRDPCAGPLFGRADGAPKPVQSGRLKKGSEMRRVCLPIVLLAIAVMASLAAAQTPSTIAYQGRLVNASGAPITSATSVQFALYAAASGGSNIWTETLGVTPDGQGVFTVELGLTTPLTTAIFDGTKRYLGVKVGSDAEMTPRQVITAAPYALRAATAVVGANAVATAMIQDNAVTGTKIADGTVGTADLTDLSITNADIAAAAGILASKLSGDAGIEFLNIGSSSTIPTTARNLGSITVSCPGPGYVLLLLNGYAVFFGDNTELDIGIGDAINTFNLNMVAMGTIDGTGTLRYEHSFCSMAVATVAAPGDRVFYATTLRPSVFSAHEVNLGGMYFVGLFIPKRY